MNPDHLQQQQQTNNTKKKKCRGNRKRQRYRRQLYNQGLNKNEVNELVEKKFPSHILQQPQQQQQQQQDNGMIFEKHNLQNKEVSIPFNRITESQLQSAMNVDQIQEMGMKRKRILLTPTPTNETMTILDKPLDHLSKLQRDPKKVKATASTITVNPTGQTLTTLDKSFTQLSILQENESKKTMLTSEKKVNVDNPMNNPTDKQESPMSSCLEHFKPRYLKVSDRIFKRILADSIENGFKLVECLNTTEKLHRIREMTEITNNLYFKDFQQKLWQEYSNISSKNQNWESKMNKRFAHRNSISRKYRPRQYYIEERLKMVSKQKEELRNQLQEYLTQLLNDIEQWQPSIDGTLLSHAINECVRHSQKRLKEEFDYKKEMLLLDWNDYQLLMKFYELKPTTDLIELAQQIWQVTADELKTKEQQEIFRQCTYLKRLPTRIDQTINSLVADNEVTLANPFLDEDQRASFASRYSKAIVQCKFNVIMIELDEFAIVIHRYDLTLNNLKEKLFKLHKENPRISTTSLTELIEQRRQAMIQRALRIRQYKLKTFFDQAPAVIKNVLNEIAVGANH